jgi:hypothetical protein
MKTQGKVLIAVLLAVLAFFGFTKLRDNGYISKPEVAVTEAPATTTGAAMTSTTDTPAATPAVSGATFNYSPPEPQDGTLKGVVELGASGFNSFIVLIDAQKRWKLVKAEYGKSLAVEGMATDADVRTQLKDYIGNMLDNGVAGKNVQFVVSSGAIMGAKTPMIVKNLRALGYVVNVVTADQEGKLALLPLQPKEYADKSFIVDIGSGNTKITWTQNGQARSLESYGAKYFQKGTSDDAVYQDVKAKASQVPAQLRKTAFIIGGVPYNLAKQNRNGKDRYALLGTPDSYETPDAKTKAGVNIYKAIVDGTGAEQVVFDFDSNFTIGFLLRK